MPKLHDRLEMQSREPDANDQPAGAFVKRFDIWAELDYQRGSESAVASRIEGTQPATILVRDTPQTRTITPAFRAIVRGGKRNGEIFNIKSVAPAQQTDHFNLIGISGVATG